MSFIRQEPIGWKMSIQDRVDKEGLIIKEDDLVIRIFYEDRWLCTVTSYKSVNCFLSGWTRAKEIFAKHGVTLEKEGE